MLNSILRHLKYIVKKCLHVWLFLDFGHRIQIWTEVKQRTHLQVFLLIHLSNRVQVDCRTWRDTFLLLLAAVRLSVWSTL